MQSLFLLDVDLLLFAVVPREGLRGRGGRGPDGGDGNRQTAVLLLSVVIMFASVSLLLRCVVLLLCLYFLCLGIGRQLSRACYLNTLTVVMSLRSLSAV